MNLYVYTRIQESPLSYITLVRISIQVEYNQKSNKILVQDTWVLKVMIRGDVINSNNNISLFYFTT